MDTKNADYDCLYKVTEGWPCVGFFTHDCGGQDTGGGHGGPGKSVGQSGNRYCHIRIQLCTSLQIGPLCTSGMYRMEGSLNKVYVVIYSIEGGSIYKIGTTRDKTKSKAICEAFMDRVCNSVRDLASYYADRFGVQHKDIKEPNILFFVSCANYQTPPANMGKPNGLDFVDWGEWEAIEKGNRAQAIEVVRPIPIVIRSPHDQESQEQE
jgi:hypothetical protein